MTKPKQTLEEILKGLLFTTTTSGNSANEKIIKEAQAKIKELVLGCLPSEYIGETSNELLKEFCAGHNRALSEVRRKLNEL